MQTLYTRRGKQRRSRRRSWLKRGLWAIAGLLALFVLGNAVMWLVYRERVLPNVSLAAEPVGNLAYSDIDKRVDVSKLLPENVTLTKGEQAQEISTQELGLAVDWPATQEQLKRQRSWLPLLNLFRHRTVPTELTVERQAFDAVLANIKSAFTKQPLPERVTFNGSAFVIAQPEDGYQLDTNKFEPELIAAVEKGKTEFSVPTTTIEADPPTGGLEDELAALQKQLSVNIQFEHAGQKTQPRPADIGAWFAQSGQNMVLSADKVRAYVQTLEPSLFNGGDAASAVSYALNMGQDITFVLESAQTPVTYTYCASVRGVGEEHLAGFAAKVAAVLGDPRGWNAGGQVGFERVENGCDFTVWLSAPGQMTSFGGVCDPFWSCRSGRNVVINFDRWQGATDAWNAAGGGLEDYRVMVANHEVGHWLGFGHRRCPGPGQPAPVMMQQSIDLKGCAFNPWPVANELNTLKQAEGLATLQPREEYLAEAPCCCAHCARA